MEQTAEQLKSWLINSGLTPEKAEEVSVKFKQNVLSSLNKLSLDDLDHLAKEIQERYPV